MGGRNRILAVVGAYVAGIASLLAFQAIDDDHHDRVAHGFGPGGGQFRGGPQQGGGQFNGPPPGAMQGGPQGTPGEGTPPRFEQRGEDGSQGESDSQNDSGSSNEN